VASPCVSNCPTETRSLGFSINSWGFSRVEISEVGKIAGRSPLTLEYPRKRSMEDYFWMD